MNIITIPYGGNHFKVHSLLYLNNRIQVFYLEKKKILKLSQTMSKECKVSFWIVVVELQLQSFSNRILLKKLLFSYKL